MELSLAEELLLIALKDKKGTVHLSASGGLTFGIAGAVLMDLYLDGRIKREGKRLIAAAGPASKDPVLEACRQKIQEMEKAKTIRHWIEKFGGNNKLRNAYLERLVQKNILARERKKLLWVFPADRYPEIDPRPESAERSRLRAAVLEGKPADDRTHMLISLIRACDLVGEVFPGPEKKEAKKSIKAMVNNEPFGRAVADEIAAVIGSVIAASAAAVAVSASS
jgi:hypothetical protein